ncbi:hypothetical protein [Superficieibacter sp. HKU1]|uniref:hypothetical protein n=1 Tax=Superficieibacter sp. HKU1 TaxID=3031919 RepID=UPI0023E0BADC|nr:hypothetical protein [Superficieibacter sp. HKU1]WES67654.1 hypothetical protein P0H77_18900 [Superficieibacter sp. HKU1]
MIPETLIPARFHTSAAGEESEEAENSASLTQGKRTLAELENDILTSIGRNGFSRNMLLEERDRHIKDRLFRVVKIETFCHVLNELQANGDFSAQELSQILADKTLEINESGNDIWLNLITREKIAPMFYDLEDE